MMPLTLLMLDYDGTLTPIVPNYELAQIEPERVNLLKRLTQRETLRLAIVSGRSVEQLLAFLSDLEGWPVMLVGLHGGQIYDLATGQFLLTPEPIYMEGIQALAHAVEADPVFARPGIQIENKAFSLGIHYRQASLEDGKQALKALISHFETLGLGSNFGLKPGKQLMEVVPQSFNKGTGVETLIEIVSAESTSPLHLVYIGDDVTDFDAFRVVSALGGEVVYVGQSLPEAVPPGTHQLASVEDVYAMLQARFSVSSFGNLIG